MPVVVVGLVKGEIIQGTDTIVERDGIGRVLCPV